MKSIFTYLSAAALVAMTAVGMRAERTSLRPEGSEPSAKAGIHQMVTSKSDIIPQPLKAAPDKAGVSREENVLVEDFDNVPDGEFVQTGNIGMRATTLLASHYFEPGRYIDTEYTPKTGTWEGDWVFAGKDGSVILQCYNPQAGSALRTPLGDFSGDLTVRMRVRKARTFWGADDADDGYVTANGSYFTVRVGMGGYDSYDSPLTDIGGMGTLESGLIYTDDWVEFEFTFRNESANHDGYIEITTPMAVEIDWIHVTDACTYLACPVVNQVTRFTNDGFTINWDPVRRSGNYYLDLWQVNYTADSGVNESIDFESGTIPAGWEADEAVLESGKGVDGGYAIQIGYDGEAAALVSPDYGMKLGSYEIQAMFEINDAEAFDQSKGYGLLLIDGLTEDGWVPLNQVCCDNFFTQGGMYYRFKGEGENFEGRYSALRFYTDGVADANHVLIDNVKVWSERPYELQRVVADGYHQYIPQEGDNPDYPYNYWIYTEEGDPCTYTFTGLDPDTEYWYRVRSHYMRDFTIGQKYHAFGVASPELRPATPVGGGAYTANWIDVAKAQNFIVRNYQAIQVVEAEEDRSLFNEEFSKCTGAGNINGLTEIGNAFMGPLDEYTDMPGWTGQNNAYAGGLLGGLAYGASLITPMLPVNSARGGYNIYIEALGVYGETLVVNFLDRGTYGYLNFDDAGTVSGVLSMEDAVTGERIRFVTLNGMPFALAAFEVSQNVEEGDIIRTYIGDATMPAGTQAATFTGLDSEGMYAYQVVSKFDLEKQTAYSESGDLMVVDMKSGNSFITGILDINSDITEVERFNSAGLKVDAGYKGVVIVRMSDGSMRKMIAR